ncbi:Heparanase-like protein 3 [Linum grandiflorum]
MYKKGGKKGDMGSQILVVGFLVTVCILSCSFVPVSSQGSIVEGTVVVDGTTVIGRTDDDFICATLDWWPPEKCDYGTCSWDHTSLINLDLNDEILLKAIQAFSPLKIRLGGTLQDKVIYDTPDNHMPCTQFVKNSTELFGFTQGCLPMYRWDELNSFFTKSGAKIIFGLNALMGRTIQPDGSAAGPWNYSNAQSFITYSVKHNYSIHGWELGNELSGSGVGTRVPADQYASDTISLYDIVDNVYSGIEPKPLVMAPAGFYDSGWFKTLINKAGSSLDIVTHHIYNLGPGVDAHLVEKILNPAVLDNVVGALRGLQSLLRISKSSANAWVGEAGGAYNSGRNLVSNAFVYSFWYLDQLGLAAVHDTKTYCRQSLIGGNYGLLNTTTYVPNPDYYRHHNHRTEIIQLPHRSNNGETRDEYHLTAEDGNLHSQTMLLNGKGLQVNSDGDIPEFEPLHVNSSEPISVAPLSIVFARVPYILPACR